MYNRQIDTFLKVAETGSFSKAAQAAYISPAAVIQQINALEKNLQTELFRRTKQGVTLTEAGVYFRSEAMEYVRRDREIRQKLAEIAGQENSFRVGISMFQKARLALDLWALFSVSDSSLDLKLVNVSAGGMQADLIEGVGDGQHWQQEMEFFKICDVPMGIGIPRGHRMYAQSSVTMEELKGQTVLLPGNGASPELQALQGRLRKAGVLIREIGQYDQSVVWDCSCNLCLVAAPLCMRDVLSELAMVPCPELGSIPYGFFVRREATAAVREFLEFTRGVYNGTIDTGMIPVLE
ncbi:MAG: LysR family transcriptional regulator [Lachnospiraceae bacterium]|nr:LysR family transcriptional regulator [Lachnospiraceae bacterium]